MQMFSALPEGGRLKAARCYCCFCLVTPPLHQGPRLRGPRTFSSLRHARDRKFSISAGVRIAELTVLNLRIRSSYALAGTWRYAPASILRSASAKCLRLPLSSLSKITSYEGSSHYH